MDVTPPQRSLAVRSSSCSLRIPIHRQTAFAGHARWSAKMRDVDMTAQLNPRDDLHPARRLPAPCPFPRKGHAPRAWRMKAFRFACWADSIEMMSPHIASMLASAIHKSIFAILNAINASHAATAFDLGSALLLSGKLPREDRPSSLGFTWTCFVPRVLTIHFQAFFQPTQSRQRAVGTLPTAAPGGRRQC